MDIRIDGPIDGIETAEQLNRIRPVPVIYLTAHSDEATLLRARDSSPFGYLLKPFSEREMHATIQMALARFETQETLRASRDEVRRLADDLDRRVKERTRELEDVLAELQDFCHAVAHDLRAPLQTIAGLSTLLRRGEGAQLPPAALRQLDRIADITVHMERMMNGLLALARIARAPLARREVDLSRFARETARELAERDPQRLVDFVIVPEAVADADPNTAEVVMENLLQYAWKCTADREHARIEFGVRRFPDETIFHVSDDGAGFDMALAIDLFRPFNRPHTPGESPGSGIGLATVHRIVRRHGGRIWADSEVDRGTTIYFTLAPALEAPSLEGLPN
jgi:light-regulated signal transduction histidine kinase (bacteriophytochrome)